MSQEIEKIENRIDKITEEFTVSKYNLYKISHLKKIVEKSFEFGDQCLICKSNQKEFEKALDMLELVDEDIDKRNEYGKWFLNKRDHLIKQHGFKSPNHYSAIYAMLMLIIFIAVSAGVSMIWFSKLNLDLMLMSSAVGIIIGYVLGSVKDRKIRKAERII